MSSWLGEFHDWTKKWDPLDHALVDGAWKTSTNLVHDTSNGLVRVGNALGISTKVPQYGADVSQKDKQSFSRWGENTLGSAGLIYGGIAAAGGEAGAGGGAAGGAADAGGAGAAAGGGGAGAAGDAAAGGGLDSLGTGAGYVNPVTSGGSGVYSEAGGSTIYSEPGTGPTTWLNADGTSGTTPPAGQGGGGMNWGNFMKKGLNGMNQSGSQQPRMTPANDMGQPASPAYGGIAAPQQTQQPVFGAIPGQIQPMFAPATSRISALKLAEGLSAYGGAY